MDPCGTLQKDSACQKEKSLKETGKFEVDKPAKDSPGDISE